MAQPDHVLQGYAELATGITQLRDGSDGRPVGLVLSRLRGLQAINERHGFAAGDHAVLDFGQRLLQIARQHDRVLRLGSNLFALLIHAPLNAGHVLLAAERIGRLADERISHGDDVVRLDVSMGCALLVEEDNAVPAMIARAESALEQCRLGDSRVLFLDAADSPASVAMSHPLFDARQAIENGEFRVHYQPQLRLADQHLVGAEALVRWRGPEGLVAPGSFMNEVERARSLAPLLQFVMNTCSREMARWVRWTPQLRIAINSSANDLEDGDLVNVMRDVLGIWGLDPQHIKLEITETSLMRNPAAGISTLEALRELGIRTSIDDFGTGYSSLGWLKDLPVDELKIDRSFVLRMVEDRRDRQLVRSIIELAHVLGLSVVAEGIETAGAMHALREVGCDVGQGYHFSPPVTASEFERDWVITTARADAARATDPVDISAAPDATGTATA